LATYSTIADWLRAYPIATASTAALYVVLLALAIPRSRRILAPWLVHPTAPTQQYLQAFDTFRGFAAAFVALGHCWWASYPVFASTQSTVPFLAYGAKAVPEFAVLSGFLIYRSVLLIKSLEDLRTYTIRRFFRIYPVYLLSVILCLASGQYLTGEYFSSRGYLFSDLFMFNIISWPGGFANPVTWSLYVEATFYAFLPLVVLTVGRKRMVVFALLGLAAMIVADYPSRVFGLWKFFLIGILASELSWAKFLQYKALPRVKPVAALALVIGFAMLVYDLGGPKHDWVAKLGVNPPHADGETLGLGLACALILAALPHSDILARMLNVLPLRVLGIISYSLYIVHFFYILANFPEIGLFTKAGTPPLYEHFKSLAPMPAWYMPFIFFPGALFWALISFLLVERPGIRLGKWLITKTRFKAPPMTAQSLPTSAVRGAAHSSVESR
jgi:peptidoglycan/LPS O-acetylase OafA/YrhL